MQAIEAGNRTLSTSKEAIDLYEAVSTTLRLKPVELELDSLDQLIDILTTHPVRSSSCAIVPSQRILTLGPHVTSLSWAGIFT